MKLLPHQAIDAKLMARGDDLPNFSEAGTGKTHSTLEAIKLADFRGGLIVAPTIALPMWKEEIESYLGASAGILRTGKSTLKGDKDFYVTSYGLASNRDLRHRILYWAGGDDKRVLVADESQYIKTPGTARTKAILGPSTTGRGGLFEVFDQCYMLSGTPILRYLDDMWAQLRATHPDVLRAYNVVEYEQFQNKFCVMQVKQHNPRMRPTLQAVASKNEALLNRMLYEEIGAIRRTMDEVEVTMPPLTYRNVYVKIKRDSTLSAMMKDIDFDRILAGDEPDEIMVRAMRIIAELKLEGCIDYVLEQPHQVVLGYWNTDVGIAAANMLTSAGCKVGIVNGSTPMHTREEIRKAFNAGTIDVLVGQMAAMNTAWNLQESGHHVVILQDQFSPGVIEQFIKRVWRIGQGKHVQVDFIKAEHPLDETVQRVRENKAASADKTLDPRRVDK